MHTGRRTPLRRRTKIGRVSEHFRKRNECGYDRNAARTRFHFVDLAAAAVKVAVYRAHIFFGRYDLDLHYRLEQDRLCLFNSVLERKAAGDVERTFVRIHFVIRTENKACLDIDKLVSGEESATHRVLNTFGNRLDELTRNGAAGDL